MIITRGSVAVTLSTRNNWWNIKLQRSSYISHIDIYNRQDCCGNRLHGTQIFLDDNFLATISYKYGVNKYSYKVEKNGKFIYAVRTSLHEQIHSRH